MRARAERSRSWTSYILYEACVIAASCLPVQYVNVCLRQIVVPVLSDKKMRELERCFRA